MTREAVLQRLELLRRDRQQAEAAAERAVAVLHAHDGAIQEAEYWLGVLDEQARQPDEVSDGGGESA